MTSGNSSVAELSLDDFELVGSLSISLLATSVRIFKVSAILSKAALTFGGADLELLSMLLPSQSMEIGAGGAITTGGFWMCIVWTVADHSRPTVDRSRTKREGGTKTFEAAHRKNKTLRRCSQAFWLLVETSL